MRLDMLIRLIMRALCRGAYQQCVRYCGTGVLLPPHLRRRCLLLPPCHQRAIVSRLQFAQGQGRGREGGEKGLFNASDRRSGPIFTRIDSLTFLLAFDSCSVFFFLENVYRWTQQETLHALFRFWRPPGALSYVDVKGPRGFSKAEI